MARLSISTWSLHRSLGPMYRQMPNGSLIPNDPNPGAISLLEAPAWIAERGIRTLEICHFHFPRVDDEYIDDLVARSDMAGVELFSILIDMGDITSPNGEKRAADEREIRQWIDVAARCGARHVRVIAGDAEPDAGGAAVRLSADGLLRLAAYARERGVKVITENFRALTRRAKEVREILSLCDGQVGICADFGNFSGPTKYDDLKLILPLADSVHAKAHYPEAGEMDREDFVRCLDLSREAGFGGPYSLIFDGPGDEWESLAEIQAVVEQYL